MLKNKRLLTIVSKDYDDLEFHYPLIRLTEAGATVDVAAEVKNQVYQGKYGLSTQSDLSFDEVDITKYDGILIPGGWAPDKLRRYPELLEIVRKLNEQNKPIGHICHAGWVLISADILKGRKSTSTPAIQDDMRNAGAEWVDEPVVVDGNIISSRKPDDLPVYAKAYADKLAE